MYLNSNDPVETTYTHDYKSPSGGRYKFLEGKTPLKMSDVGGMYKIRKPSHLEPMGAKIPQREHQFMHRFDDDDENKNHFKPDPCACQCPALSKHDQVYKTFMKDCADPAWNSPAPYGCLIEPRLEPTTISKEQAARLALDFPPDCFRTQPNRFLKVLRYAYPELYKFKKHIPPELLFTRTAGPFIGSTYQYDFCNVREFPDGVYKSLTEMDEEKKMTARQLLHTEPACYQLRRKADLARYRACGDTSVALCDDGNEFAPFRIEFRDKATFGYSGNEGHWRSQGVYSVHADWPQYQSAIKKFGCIPPRTTGKDKCGGGVDKDCAHFYANLCGNWRPLGHLAKI